jgi:hypothetical protein
LIQQSVTNVPHGHLIRAEIKNRMVSGGFNRVSDLLRRPPPPQEVSRQPNPPVALEPSPIIFPWQNEEKVLSWMERYQPWQLAEEAREAGYQGEHMRDPADVVEWMNTAIFNKTEWRDLNPEVVRFWKAFHTKYTRWVANS